MMNEKNIKKMNELLANEEFAQKFADAGSYENAYKLFTENGVDASCEDFMAYVEQSRKIMEENGLIYEDGEMSIELLEQVAGGGKVAGFVVGFAGAALVATGVLTMPGLVLVGLGCSLWYN